MAELSRDGEELVLTLTTAEKAELLHTARGVRVRLEDGAFSELLVGCADPEVIAASITKES